jgi:beta-catenin-like protein 1
VHALMPASVVQFKENMEARMKYADQPDKFMESEVDLDEEVRRLQAIAGNPELYPELIRLNAMPSLLNLLSHDNADIAGDVIELLNELTDSDVVEDSVWALLLCMHR